MSNIHTRLDYYSFYSDKKRCVEKCTITGFKWSIGTANCIFLRQMFFFGFLRGNETQQEAQAVNVQAVVEKTEILKLIPANKVLVEADKTSQMSIKRRDSDNPDMRRFFVTVQHILMCLCVILTSERGKKKKT